MACITSAAHAEELLAKPGSATNCNCLRQLPARCSRGPAAASDAVKHHNIAVGTLHHSLGLVDDMALSKATALTGCVCRMLCLPTDCQAQFCPLSLCAIIAVMKTWEVPFNLSCLLLGHWPPHPCYTASPHNSDSRRSYKKDQRQVKAGLHNSVLLLVCDKNAACTHTAAGGSLSGVLQFLRTMRHHQLHVCLQHMCIVDSVLCACCRRRPPHDRCFFSSSRLFVTPLGCSAAEVTGTHSTLCGIP